MILFFCCWRSEVTAWPLYCKSNSCTYVLQKHREQVISWNIQINGDFLLFTVLYFTTTITFPSIFHLNYILSYVNHMLYLILFRHISSICLEMEDIMMIQVIIISTCLVFIRSFILKSWPLRLTILESKKASVLIKIFYEVEGLHISIWAAFRWKIVS